MLLGGGFGRQSFIGIGSRRWGSLQAGVQYTPMFFNLLPAATFGMNAQWAPIQVVTRPSKRTTLYARALHVENHGGAAIVMGNATVTAGSGDDVRSLALGIKHTF